MRLIENTRIATKIAAIVVVLSLLSVGYVLYLTSSMKDIDERYSVIVDREAEAAVLLVKANSEVTELGYHAYKAVAYPGASAEAKQAKSSYEASAAGARDSLTKAGALVPNYGRR